MPIGANLFFFKVDELKAKAENKEAGLMARFNACTVESIEAKRADELGELKNKVMVILALKYMYFWL